jgi:CBS domain containing-hemolysin-like protein
VEDLVELFPGADGVDSLLTDVLEAADVDTVGGLLAHRLGRVPLPGARAEVPGLRLLAEGGKDARGRIRINTVLVEPVEAGEDDEERDGAGAERTGRREESDVRPG